MSFAIPALGGCAAPTSGGASPEERVATATQADTAAYVQSFDPAAQAIVFQPASSIDWVIAHVTIDGTRTTNVGMPATGSSYTLASLPLLPGDTLVYSFTYATSGLAQDTPQYSYTLPASWQPTVFRTSVASSDAGPEIVVASSAPLAWADVHYTVNGGTQANVRLAQQGADYVQPVTLDPGDVLQYSVTYSTGAAVFDTAVARYVAGSSGARFVVDLGADSTTGACVADGDSGGHCNVRAALAAAQAAAGPVTIDLSVDSTVSAGPIAIASPATLTLESLPGGAAHGISGTGTGRFLSVASGANVTLRDLSITHFTAFDTPAAILNAGTLDLEGVTLTGNSSTCSDVGAMTAFATCSGGAVANSGTLTLGGGTTFSNNTVTASAGAAAFTNAWAAGGAISNSGTLTIVSNVLFSGNAAVATANSGFHPEPVGGATATALGGAIYNSGTLTMADVVLGRNFSPPYIFLSNSASATGSTVYGTTALDGTGGAIENTGTLHFEQAACVFAGNTTPQVDG